MYIQTGGTSIVGNHRQIQARLFPADTYTVDAAGIDAGTAGQIAYDQQELSVGRYDPASRGVVVTGWECLAADVAAFVVALKQHILVVRVQHTNRQIDRRADPLPQAFKIQDLATAGIETIPVSLVSPGELACDLTRILDRLTALRGAIGALADDDRNVADPDQHGGVCAG